GARHIGVPAGLDRDWLAQFDGTVQEDHADIPAPGLRHPEGVVPASRVTSPETGTTHLHGPAKPGRHAPGLDLVRYAATLTTGRPWFAIGGIDAANLDEVTEAGARRVVVVRALTEADDPKAAAAGFARRLRAL
ncbi:thiamine phosphate synthase, partial [Streptomyces albidoflavus]|uniref:thiamine phosphate synthase n=1 Tax=Streptomyces albidoflavus TaxID=1886 RepID=UPI00211C667F